MNTEIKTAKSLNGKYLTFTLHHESYGIDVLKVREIIRHSNITAVPQMPAHFTWQRTSPGRSSGIGRSTIRRSLGPKSRAARMVLLFMMNHASFFVV